MIRLSLPLACLSLALATTPLASASAAEAGTAAALDADATVFEAGRPVDGGAPSFARATPPPNVAGAPAEASAQAPASPAVGDTAGDSQPARWEIFARLGSRWITDPALDLASEQDAIFMGGVGFGYKPGWVGDRLSLELSFDASAANATSFDVLKARFDILAIGAALAYRLPVHEGGSLVARGGGSFDWASVQIEDDRSPALTQTARIFGLQATLGYELALVLDHHGPPDSTAVLLRADAGYALYPSAARFDDLQRDRDDDLSPRPIGSRGADLGELDPSGFLYRLGIGLRF